MAMPSLTTPGKILLIELENFKSYKGHHTIGPFLDFTAITGPIDSGKSNLIDAICFVLGVRTGQLRGAQQKDLIYAFDDREKEQKGRRAFVKLVYQLGGTELHFTRTITGAGGSEYWIDGIPVNWDEYCGKLKSLGILVKAQSFLVFQGDVESIASKNPKELTALLEQISGSDEDKKLYEDLEEKKASAEEKSALIYQKKRTVVMERKQKKEEKEEAEKHIRLQELLKIIEDELSKLMLERENIKNEIDRIEPELVKLNRTISCGKGSISSLEARINDIVYRIYKDFSREVGVKNIREFEEKQLADSEERLSNQQSKLKYQLEYEQKRDMASPPSRLAKLGASLSELNSALNQVEVKEGEVKSITEQATNEIDQWKEEVQEWKSQSERCEKDIQEWNKKISAGTTNITKHNRQIGAKETQIEQLNSRKKDIVENCEVEQISFPTVDTESTQGQVFDFSQLTRSLQQNMRPADREKAEVEFKQKIGKLVSDIVKTAPNLKALDQYAALQEREREVTKEFEEARDEEKQVAAEFNKVKQRRYELFMEAFNHISTNIDRIYKQLTKSDTHKLGGTAYLKLDNEDEPFLHGIKYTTMPPTKRFCDMEQLSGGEKTVAVLALLFSIHSFRPSPFFILDEVDAALDDFNVAKFARFIRSKSCEGARTNQDPEGGSGFQSIVISRKDSFYANAEALVGVYRDFDKGSSSTFTLDLTKYHTQPVNIRSK